jgi:hypothetical protein
MQIEFDRRGWKGYGTEALALAVTPSSYDVLCRKDDVVNGWHH